MVQSAARRALDPEVRGSTPRPRADRHAHLTQCRGARLKSAMFRARSPGWAHGTRNLPRCGSCQTGTVRLRRPGRLGRVRQPLRPASPRTSHRLRTLWTPTGLRVGQRHPGRRDGRALPQGRPLLLPPLDCVRGPSNEMTGVYWFSVGSMTGTSKLLRSSATTRSCPASASSWVDQRQVPASSCVHGRSNTTRGSSSS